ncbi:MAG: hypothetical protein IPP71_01405 [Bacteroidetes bacterium]|nr:hypothetical protein [Bacteroidota bacterium]
MNSQLNKDLFSETGCVKYPQLLAYRNGKLKQSDKHEVERHLIDCELCSDALEGFVLVTTGDPMEEVNTNIRELVKPVQQVHYKNYFIAAASVAAIVILSIFSYQQFLEVNNERLAVSESVQQPEQLNLNESNDTLPAMSAATIQDTGAINDAGSNLNLVNPQPESTSNKRQAASSESESSAAPVVLPPLVQPKKLDAELLSDAVLESTASAANEEDSPESSDVLRPAAGTYSSGNFITYVDNLKVIDYKDVDTENAKDQSLDKSTPVKFENKEKSRMLPRKKLFQGHHTHEKLLIPG